MTFEFDRYINGQLMAEGVTIERQDNLPDAMREAARIASRGPNGEVPVLVLRAEALSRTGAVKVKRLIAELEQMTESDRTHLREVASDEIKAIIAALEAKLAALSPAPEAHQEPVAWQEPELTCPHIERAVMSGELSPAVVDELAAIREINSQLRYGTWALKAQLKSNTRPTEAMVEAAQRIRDVAMRQTIAARLPECGEFGGIAQDADWLVDALKAAMEARDG